ncbi:hypothetical protein [Streptomyces sp. NHF165]|uniref:hypothetical protein n=1 Tax=Streptomyces sp. NHF165 TaxID=2175864 RepID=UPI001F2635E9|nr:hypothetical protein [Streptomyces sp. NHF165]
MQSLLLEASKCGNSTRRVVALALGLRQGEAFGPQWETSISTPVRPHPAEPTAAEAPARVRFFASPTSGPLRLNTDHHVWKRLLRDAGVRGGRMHDACHAPAT